MKFFLGTHKPNWLRGLTIPLFVSRRMLARYKTPPRAAGKWALDSGGFSELSMFGEWQTAPKQYAEEVRRWMDECGGLEWAAAQDSMCEPFILAKTGKSVSQHQQATVENYLTLKSLAPDLPFVPVLQGYSYADYLACWERYERAGVRLASEPLVGLGSVCRRQETGMVEELIRELHGEGIRLHGFGVKTRGLANCGRYLASSDSMAWSFTARRDAPLPGHEKRHKSCANCKEYALRWRERVLKVIRGSEESEQCLLFHAGSPFAETAIGVASSAPEGCASVVTRSQR